MSKYKTKWDLTHLFASDAAWEEAFENFKPTIETVTKFKGRLGESPETLLDALKAAEALSRQFRAIFSYSSLRMDQNTKDPKTQDMRSRAASFATTMGSELAFITPELLALDEGWLRETAARPEFAVYRHNLEDTLRTKPHVLPAEIEQILAASHEFSAGAQRAYSMLQNADMTFPDVTDSKGESHKLTMGSYIKFLESEDRTLRESAFKNIHGKYKENINTIAALMETEVKKNIFYAKTKKFGSAREAALFRNNVPVSVMDSLINSVHQHLPKMYEVLELRRKQLGVDKLHMYDMYVPLVSGDFNIPFDEAADTILEAIKPMGDDYVSVVKKGFEEGWVDAFETEGKRGGAYSAGTYDAPPYILMNYSDNLNSMFTLAHEFGHSMHTYLTNKNQEPANSGYSIFVAEVASTTNEALLNHHLIKNEDDLEKRKLILGHYIDSFRATVFRQTMFAEFERDIHAYSESGGSLTADYLCEHYVSLIKKYFGPDVHVDDEIRYEWARIPHMYYNFYVFQYATGFSAAIALSSDIIANGPEKTLGFLKSGSSDYPINVLRNAGVDMESEEPVSRALKVFADSVDKFKDLF